MDRNFNFPVKFFLDRNNYDLWFRMIKTVLNKYGLNKFIESDYLTSVKRDVKAKTKSEDELEKAFKEENFAIEIILSSVTDKPLNIIKDIETPYEMMQKLKKEYDRKSSNDTQHYVNKLKTLKSKSIKDCHDTIMEMMRIFEILEKKKYFISDLEKIKFIYKAIPKTVKSLVIATDYDKVEEYVKKINKSLTVYNYLEDLDINEEKETSKNDEEDKMDIDYVSAQKKTSKYCHICERKGHLTKECRYNLKRKFSNKNKNKNNDKKYYKNKGKFSNDKKQVGYIETSYQDDENLDNETPDNETFDDETLDEELFELQGKEINNLETFKIINHKPTYAQVVAKGIQNRKNKENEKLSEINLIKTSKIQKQNNNDLITWTYDTGCSEHITHDKNILNGYRNDETLMRCANNAICKFEGVGSFEGTINNHPIRLKEVYYSKDVNKNLLSGVKLANDGLTCEIQSEDNEICLKLKKRKGNSEQTIGKFPANENNIIKISTRRTGKTINNISKEKNKGLKDNKITYSETGEFTTHKDSDLGNNIKNKSTSENTATTDRVKMTIWIEIF